MPLLNASNMSGGYGGADILFGCSIEVDRGEVTVIVGPNGAGKSTAMKAIFGLVQLRAGSVVLDGADITGLPPEARGSPRYGFRTPDPERICQPDGAREPRDGGPICDLTTSATASSKCSAYSRF